MRHPFVRLKTAAGAVLTASPAHYVYVVGAGPAGSATVDGRGWRLVRAAEVRRGDVLPLAAGAVSAVVGRSLVELPGLYNPHTLDGDIVVDGVVVSTWTAAVPPAVASAALAPLRWLAAGTAGGRAAGAAQAVARVVGAGVGSPAARSLLRWAGRVRPLGVVGVSRVE